MDNDDCKTWMLKRGECEDLHCPHLYRQKATLDEPEERDCMCPGLCPFSEPAEARFAEVRRAVTEEALTENWERLIGGLETLLTTGRSGDLVAQAEAVIDEHARKVLEARHEI